MSSFANISIRILADLKQFSSQMQNAQRDMQKMGQNMQKVGQGLTLGITAPLVAIAGLSVKTFATFEQSLAKVAAVSGASASQMAALRKNAEDLGASTRFAASEVAGLQLNLSKLGFKPDEILATTDAILDLALASGEDLALSATIAASTMRAFGIETQESGRVVDIMAKSFSSSALDLNKFSVAMGSLAPVAKNAGVGLEEATSYLSILVDRGVEASTAGTGLRNIFLRVAEMGIPLKDALDKISNATDKNAVAMKLFGTKGATVSAIMADNRDEAYSLETAYKNSAGAAKAMAKVMDNTLEGSFFKLKSATESAAIALGEELAPMIRKVAEFAAGLISGFKDLDSSTKRIIVIIGALAAAIGPLLLVAGALMTTVIPGLIALGPAFASFWLAITGPVGLVVIGLGLAVAAFASFRGESEKVMASQASLTSITRTATKAIEEEKAKVEALLFTARDENVSKQQRIKAIQELNKISPKYLGNLSLETINTDKARESIEKYNDALLKTAKAKAAQEKLQEIQAKIIEKELELSRRRKKLQDDEANAFKGTADNAAAAALSKDHLRKARVLLNIETKKGTKALEAEAEALLQIINLNDLAATTKTPGSGSPDSEGRRKTEGASLFDTAGNEALNPFAALQMQADLMPEITAAMNAEELKMLDNALQFNEGLSEIMGGAAETFAVGFAEMIGSAASGGVSLQGIGKFILSTLADVAINVGKMAIAIGFAVEGIKKALQSLSGPVAIAAGIALIALGTFAKTALGNAAKPKSRTAFANGGIVYGPTDALIGEYMGAKNDPEVVAPLSKLKDLLGQGGPGQMDITVKGVLRGTDIYLQKSRVDNYINRRT